MGGGTWVTGTRRRTRVQSPVAFQAPVRVGDPDVALREAQDVVLPRYLAALAALTGSPLYGVPVAFHPADEPEKWCPRMSEANVQQFVPRLLEVEEPDVLAGLVWAAEHDHTARLAALEINVANNYLHSRTDDLADVRAILLTYFFVLERIANRVARYYPLRPKPAETWPAIEKLERALGTAANVEAKVQAVRTAAQALQAQHSRGIKRRVREAGRVIGLDDDMVRNAGELTDLRNESLGHASALGHESAEMAEWLPRAQDCAHAYLSAYLRWVNERGFAAFD